MPKGLLGAPVAIAALPEDKVSAGDHPSLPEDQPDAPLMTDILLNNPLDLLCDLLGAPLSTAASPKTQ